MPKISVVMPAYNAEKYIAEAIESILNQTYHDFEFIIINDGSTDKTEEIILSYKDDRIIYLKNEKNMGIVHTLNRGLDIAKGEYIARMDSDDVSLPERLAKQLNFMEENGNIAVCGCEVEIFNDKNAYNANTVFGKEDMKINMIFSSCLCHPAVMMRKSVLDNGNFRYDKTFEKVEDYELWTRIFLNHDLENVRGYLYRYRVHENQITQNYTEYHKELYKKIKQNLLNNLKIPHKEDELSAFIDFCFAKSFSQKDLLSLASLFEKIYSTNKSTLFFNDNKLKNYLKTILISNFLKQNSYSLKQLKANCSIVTRVDLLKSKTKSFLKKVIN